MLAYLDQVQRDVPEHLADFYSASPEETEELDLIAQLLEREPAEALARYRYCLKLPGRVMKVDGRSDGMPIGSSSVVGRSHGS